MFQVPDWECDPVNDRTIRRIFKDYSHAINNKREDTSKRRKKNTSQKKQLNKQLGINGNLDDLKKNNKLKQTVRNKVKKIESANVITLQNNKINKNVKIDYNGINTNSINNKEVFVENLKRKIEQKKNKRLLKRLKRKDNLKNAELLNNKSASYAQSNCPSSNTTQRKTKSNKKENRKKDDAPDIVKKIKAPASVNKKDIVKSKSSLDNNNVNTKESLKQVKGPSTQSSSLREKMLNKLKASRFRYLNEQLYTNESKNARKLFGNDPKTFKAYHEGYDLQVAKWPINPLNLIIKSINKLPKTLIVADFGCGTAKLAKSVRQKVHSFDLIAVDDTVTACDVAHVPLENKSVDVVVFCLSLMGTNLRDYILEANRVLKDLGSLKIVEVESRFDKVETFIREIQQFGFKNTWSDLSHNLFYFLDFKKVNDCKKKNKLPSLHLNPCLYKKR